MSLAERIASVASAALTICPGCGGDLAEGFHWDGCASAPLPAPANIAVRALLAAIRSGAFAAVVICAASLAALVTASAIVVAVAYIVARAI